MNIVIPIILILVVLFGFTAFTGAPYVPSLKSEVKKAFTKLYRISSKDFLIDLGAGDGIVQKIASEYGAKSVGIELNPIIATIAKIRLRNIKNAKIVTKNFYNYKFPRETTVVYVFGDSRDLSKIFKKIEKEAKRLSKTLKVISYGFETKDYELLKKAGAYFLYEVR